jgi:hypothetical protein
METPIMNQKPLQIATPKNIPVLINETEDDLYSWSAIYFATQVTTSPRSQKEQRRDLSLFLTFMAQEFGNTLRSSWSPRVSRNFLTALQITFKEDGSRKWVGPDHQPDECPFDNLCQVDTYPSSISFGPADGENQNALGRQSTGDRTGLDQAGA